MVDDELKYYRDSLRKTRRNYSMGLFNLVQADCKQGKEQDWVCTVSEHPLVNVESTLIFDYLL